MATGGLDIGTDGWTQTVGRESGHNPSACSPVPYLITNYKYDKNKEGGGNLPEAAKLMINRVLDSCARTASTD